MESLSKSYLKLLRMRKLILLSLLFISFENVYSQNTETETKIRKVEKDRIAAILKKDTAALSKIWGKEYFANRPAGRISPRNKVLELILKDTLNLTTYNSQIEQIIIRSNIVVTMGSEIVMPGGNNPNAGKMLNRRFTHIWTKEDGEWRLLARHANIMCE